MSTVLGQLFALATAACWAQNSIVYSTAGRRVGSVPVTHVRLWIALPVMVVVHAVFTGTLVPTHVTLSGFITLSLSGLLGFCVADLFIFRGFVEIGHRETLVIMTLSPIFATALSWFSLHERLELLELAGIAVTILGIAWVVFAENRRSPRSARTRSGADLAIGPGDAGSRPAGTFPQAVSGHRVTGFVFALLGAAAQAAGMVLAKQGIGAAVHPMSANLIRITAGLAGLIVFRIAGGGFIRDFRKMRDRKALLLTASGALVGPVLGIILTLYALRLAPVGIVTTIMQTSPILLLPVDRFIFQKRLPFGAYAGTVLAVGGAVLLFW